jgi:hypothetical protein
MIEEYKGGRMTVNGLAYEQDLKLLGEEVVPEWWRERDHRLEKKDIEDILAWHPDVLVVGQGFAGHMQVGDSVRSSLSEQGIDLAARETGEAVKLYNDLHSKGAKVAGAFHLTC